MDEQTEAPVVIDEDGNILPQEDQRLNDVGQSDQEHSDDDDDLDGQSDQNAQPGESDDEKRERRRLERRNRREHQRQQRDELQRLVAAQNAKIVELDQQLNALTNRNAGADMAQLDQALRDTVGHLDRVKQKIRDAGEANNWEALAEANEEYYITRRRAEHLQAVRQQVHQAQRQPQPMDAQVQAMAVSWMDRNKWFDPAAQDNDSRVVRTLDRALTDEGWDPKTKEYWDELDARAKKYLPHRYGTRYNQTNRGAESPVSGSSRSASVASKRQIVLSPERVKALKAVGMWDDPQLRARAVKQYEEWDRNNAKEQ